MNKSIKIIKDVSPRQELKQDSKKIIKRSGSIKKTSIKKLTPILDPSRNIKPIKNTFDIVQFKKMIGKDIVKEYSGININKKKIAVEVAKIKDKIMTSSIKSISLSGYINNGIVYIFSGIDKLYAVQSISYVEIKNNLISADISILQYPKLSADEIMKIINKL